MEPLPDTFYSEGPGAALASGSNYTTTLNMNFAQLNPEQSDLRYKGMRPQRVVLENSDFFLSLYNDSLVSNPIVVCAVGEEGRVYRQRGQ